MNIFVLHTHPKVCAQFHCDRHVVKMILETAQLLSNVAPPQLCLYKQTHMNHPCSKWARESFENFLWLYELGTELGIEYTHRYGKYHKSVEVMHLARRFTEPGSFKTTGRTPFALCMPDKYKTDDPVASYRNYYIGEKKRFAKYTKRTVPHWL